MTRSFFQSLEEFRVSYLLISGQATVLYGAAAFSEDIDLWIEPSQPNIDSLKAALRSVNARYYKLTPPLTVDLMEKGHGFHFVLPEAAPVYLDVLGRPPRVGPFALAKASSTVFETEWGTIPVIGLRDLVEVKKTQRLEDYAIISRLAVEWLDRPECARVDDDFKWALENIFTLEQLEIFTRARMDDLQRIDLPEPIGSYVRAMSATGEMPEPVENAVAHWMQQRMHQLQQADRVYWRGIIADLRRLKAENKLLPVGSPI